MPFLSTIKTDCENGCYPSIDTSPIFYICRIEIGRNQSPASESQRAHLYVVSTNVLQQRVGNQTSGSARRRKAMGGAGAERGRKHAEKRQIEGLVRVSVWVPEEKREELHRFAGQLRAEQKKQLPSEKSLFVGHRYAKKG
jgi:hypothetical protein